MKTKKYSLKQAIKMNNSTEGETIEQQVERLVNNNEPIEGVAPLIYSERKEGVRAETDIRTDRFEIAIEAMDKVDKSYKARREERQAEAEKKKAEQDAKPPVSKDEGKP